MRRFLVVNGPNLNLLGTREPDVYGRTTLKDIEHMVSEHADEIGVSVDFCQSNHEGALIDTIQQADGRYDGVVFNPGAYTHYSYALRDAVAAVSVPVVEIHISDIARREDFRHVSVIEPACIDQVKGQGPRGYLVALDRLVDHLEGTD